MAQRTLACTACHGPQGQAGPDGYYPRLAGKPAQYLYNQLIHFQQGRRHYDLMQGLLGPLDDTYLWEIATHFASQNRPYPRPVAPATDSSALARGKELAIRGDAAKGIPACVQCHGKALTGALPQTPGLLGLPQDYLNAQLGGWQTGQRKTHAPDCMAGIAKSMSTTDVHAVALWLASQTPPSPYRPDSAQALWPAGSKPITCAAPLQPNLPTATLSRGAYLAKVGNCALCHTLGAGLPYAGGRAIETPFGAVYASNLTPDSQFGIGRWTEQDFWRAMHHGESRDGRLLYPAFPYTHFTLVSRDDVNAIFEFLKSLPPVAQANTPHTLRWPYSTQWALWFWRSLYFTPATHIPRPLGDYLVNGLGHCSACHGTRNRLGALADTRKMDGGLLSGVNWFAPALPSIQSDTLPPWSATDLEQLLTTGTSRHGSVGGPMAEVVKHSTQFLHKDDAHAMATYLTTMAAPPPPPPTRTSQSQRMENKVPGAKLYQKHCAQCHGEDGRGRPNAYPSLVANRTVVADQSANLLQWVWRGGFAPATPAHPRPFGMPPFQLVMSDSEVASVLTYIRSAWGNQARQVTEFDINRLRSTQSP